MQKTSVFFGHDPSSIYLNALDALETRGVEVAPRGKRILELRPVMIEFHNPLNRVTFLKGRVINPFFQLLESMWILAGRSDVASLTDYNKSIAQFSDDGVYFNAPYGERLRHYDKSDANGHIINPIDQLVDVIRKLKEDPDTRQAIAVIYNPRFDHVDNPTKDRPCNMLLEFKLRGDKLDLTVVNRSNDLHWGTFGANLCQFATIQEAMATWLGVEVGTYFQQTDSLHIYLDDYGAKETEKIRNAYSEIEDGAEDVWELSSLIYKTFKDTEPRMSSDYERAHALMNHFYMYLEPAIKHQDTHKVASVFDKMLATINQCEDEYYRLTFLASLAKHAHNQKNAYGLVRALESMPDSTWKVSCLRFLYKTHQTNEQFKSVYAHYPYDIKNYIERKGE
ncbi:thymidylate synthase [Exiguobacterium phage vB_EalM-132]|nr:thymidylate synthase [Exiguobacterium phage vB_EalM-132]